MMTNQVVKNSTITNFIHTFRQSLNPSSLVDIARKSPAYFTRTRELTFFRLLMFLIFRSGKTINQELIRFYSRVDCIKSIVSKQALSKALRKINPKVFDSIMQSFTRIFYKSNLVKTYKGYIILAEDGTVIEAPLSKESISTFGFHKNQKVRCETDVKRVTTKMGGLFDITNDFFLSTTIGARNTSEIKLGYENLYKSIDLIRNHKSIYITDRYYGSVELFRFLELNGCKYCIRGKTNFFKEEVAKIEKDGWIDITVNKQWQRRLKHKEVRDSFESNPHIRIRVVKYELKNSSKKDETHHIYFTNLSQAEFSHKEVVELYSDRWKIETHFKYYKSELEADRFNTTCPDVYKCKILARIIALNILGIIEAELNAELHNKRTQNHVDGFKTKFVTLKDLMYEGTLVKGVIFDNVKIIFEAVSLITEIAIKNIVPIRRDRHYERYGRFMKSPPFYRFRIDGRNHPKVRRTHYGLRTVRQ